MGGSYPDPLGGPGRIKDMDQVADNLAGGDEGKPPRRTLSALAVAKLTGRKKRVVLKWAEKKGAPHDTRTSRGKKAPCFSGPEIQRWLEAQGLAPFLAESREHDDARREEEDSLDTPAAGAGADLFTAKAAELREGIDFASLTARASARIEELLAQEPPELAEPGWAARWAREFQAAFKTLREMDQSAREARTRRGDLIERATAERIRADLVRIFVHGCELLPGDVARAVATELGGLVPGDAQEQVRRIAGVAAKAMADRMRQQLAEFIVKSVGADQRKEAA